MLSTSAAMDLGTRNFVLRTVRTCIDVGSRLNAPAVALWDRAKVDKISISDRIDGIVVKASSVQQQEARLLLHFHGGAHCVGSVWWTREMIGRLSAAASATVVSVNYRLAPDHPFPAAIEDALVAWNWVKEHYPGTRVALAGESAGGNLSFALMLRLAQMRAEQPVACVTMSPWLLLDTDLVEQRKLRDPCAVEHETSTSRASLLTGLGVAALSAWERGAARCARRYCQQHPATDPLVSPVLAGEDLVKAFPPVLLHAAEDEPLAADARDMARLCESCGVPVELKLYPGNLHVFQAVPFSANARDSMCRIGIFLDRHWCNSGL